MKIMRITPKPYNSMFILDNEIPLNRFHVFEAFEFLLKVIDDFHTLMVMLIHSHSVQSFYFVPEGMCGVEENSDDIASLIYCNGVIFTAHACNNRQSQ